MRDLPDIDMDFEKLGNGRVRVFGTIMYFPHLDERNVMDSNQPSAAAAALNGAKIAEQSLPKATIEALAAEVNGKVEYQTTTTDVEGSWYWTPHDIPGAKYDGQEGTIRKRARIVSDWIEVSG